MLLMMLSIQLKSAQDILQKNGQRYQFITVIFPERGILQSVNLRGLNKNTPHFSDLNFQYHKKNVSFIFHFTTMGYLV